MLFSAVLLLGCSNVSFSICALWDLEDFCAGSGLASPSSFLHE